MVHERTASVGGSPVRYLEAGSGSPVVLLHAFPLSADMWRPQLAQPPEGARLLAPDLRGFGPEARTPARTMEEMAADVLDWLDALRIDRAAIGGLSMGGYLTFALFRLAPERFTGVILANTRAAADTAEGRANRDRMSALVREQGVSAVADQMLPKLLGETSRAAQPALSAEVRRMIESNTARGVDGAILAMRDRPDSSSLLPAMLRPALVIAGEEDALIPAADAVRMHEALPRSQLVMIPRAGHLSNLEAPTPFSQALDAFVRATL